MTDAVLVSAVLAPLTTAAIALWAALRWPGWMRREFTIRAEAEAAPPEPAPGPAPDERWPFSALG